MTVGYQMMIKGYRQNQEDKIYQKWLWYVFIGRGDKNFSEYVNMHFGSSGYRKSTKEEKEEILRRFGGK